MGSKKSSSSSSTTTNTTDNSAVAGNNATALAAGAAYTNWYQSDDDFSAYYSDNSRTSTTTTSNSGNRYTDASTSVQASDSRSWYALDNSDNSTSLQANDSRSWYALDNSDRSVTATDDRSWYSYASDDRNLSTNTSNSHNTSTADNSIRWNGVDPGALKFAETTAELLGAVNESQTDAVRFMTSSAGDLLQGMGASASDMYSRAGINNVTSWGQTTSAAERLLSGTADKLGAVWADTMDRSAGLIGAVTQQAGSTAREAIAAYQPPATTNANTTRMVLLAVGGLAALLILPRMLKG